MNKQKKSATRILVIQAVLPLIKFIIIFSDLEKRAE